MRAQGRFAGFPAEGLMDIQAIVVPGVGVAAAQAGVDDTRENQRLIYRELKVGTPRTGSSRCSRRIRASLGASSESWTCRGAARAHSGSGNGAASLNVADSIPDAGIFFSVQGNILASDEVVHLAVAAFKGTGGTMADRVMAAMEAADAQGGDRRCTCESEPVLEVPCDGKTSHVAYILVANADDTEGESFNDGQYSLFIDVTDENIQPGENANPVKTLRMRYDRLESRGVG